MNPAVETEVTIVNRLGLHARAAAKLVAQASRFESEVLIERDNRKVNAKSIMGVMMLAATRGTSLRLKATGPDADAALASLTTLIENRFGEPE